MKLQADELLSVQQQAPPSKSLPSNMNVNARLDSLEPRFSWFYVRLLLLAGVSWAIQATELVLLNFTRALVVSDIGMGSRVLALIGVGIFLGAIVGGPIFGHVADKFGRRTALVTAMLFSFGGLAMSGQATIAILLIVGRVVTGIGIGGQLSSTVVLVQELAPRSMHGRMVSLLDAFAGIGGLIGVTLAYAVAPWLGWRTTYLAVSGMVIYAVALRFVIPESPRWLASVGRTEEADAIVEKIENSHGVYEKRTVEFTPLLEPPSSSLLMVSQLRQMIPTFVLWTLWIVMTLSAYALGIYIPTLISLTGYNIFATWKTIGLLYIAQVAGSFVAAAVLDTYGLHRSFAFFATLAAVASVALGHLTWSREVVITISFVVTTLISACWSCVLTYTPGHFTTTHRGRGMGYAVGVSRLAAVGGCYLYPLMFNVWVLSVPTLCWIFGGVLTVVAVGLVPQFGYRPVSTDDEDDNSCA